MRLCCTNALKTRAGSTVSCVREIVGRTRATRRVVLPFAPRSLYLQPWRIDV